MKHASGVQRARSLFLVSALLGAGFGCEASLSAEETEQPAPGGVAGGTASTGGSAVSTAGAPAAAPPTELVDFGTLEAVCTIGSSRPCTCAGSEAQGLQYCVSASGEYSECGCVADSASAFAPAEPIPVPPCGGQECAPYEEEDTDVGAKACCTTDNRCGSRSGFIFGAACVPRGGDPGASHAACPDEAPTFLDLKGCCRPDGACGLSIDHVNNWDAGCIERTEMEKLINEGSLERDILGLLTLTPSTKQSYAPMSCAP